MTPLQKLGSMPDEELIVHEAGHWVVGLALGIEEAGITFFPPGSNLRTVANYSAAHVSANKKMIRALAGMYTQATCAGVSTIPNDLRERITKGNLFRKGESIDVHGPMSIMMNSLGLAGDWHDLVALPRQRSPDKARVLLQSVHRRLINLFEANCLVKAVDRIVSDVNLWLGTEDEDVSYAPLLIYGIGRARKVIQS